MATGITLEIAKLHLGFALEAHKKVLIQQESEVEGHRVHRAKLESILSDIKYWQNLVDELTPASEGGGMRVLRGLPL